MPIVFTTPGIADLDALLTFGVNAKTSDSPIGYFGTGFKYAIATLLRNQCRVVLCLGEESLEFRAVPKLIRDKPFSLVHLGERPLGFTTDLGKDWELWMALRELESNTRDEGGHSEFTLSADPLAGSTQILVFGEGFEQVYKHLDQIFLSSQPIATSPAFAAHPGPSTQVYYRNIRVKPLQYPGVYTYNLLANVSLTEDRTLKYDWEFTERLRLFILQSADEKFLTNVLLADRNTLEAKIHYSDCDPSEAFLKVVKENESNHSLNASAWSLYQRIERINAPQVQITLSSLERMQLNRAISSLALLQITISPDNLVFMESLPGDALGMVSNNQIYIARAAFTQGTKRLAGTLFEEHCHRTFGYDDESRSFQNFLIDKLMSSLENLLGAPL